MLFRSNDTATTEIYTLSLHDALPICEICVKAPGVFVGYWNNPEATAQAFRDGLRDTGYTEGRELVSVGIQ